MSQKFIRVYQRLDLKDIQKHLLVHGDLSSSCENCGQMELNLNLASCPKCKTDFQYVAFRDVKKHIPKLYKLSEERPQFKFIDYDDYKQQVKASQAKDFFK